MLSRKSSNQTTPVLGSEYVRVAAGKHPGNVPEDATFVTEQYCGVITWMVGIFLCPCIACCPQDSRQVYESNGRKWDVSGAEMSR